MTSEKYEQTQKFLSQTAMDKIERVKSALAHKEFDRVPFYCDELFIDTRQRWLAEGMPQTRNEQEDLFDYDFTELYIDSSMRFEAKLLKEDEQTMTVADKYGFVATRNKFIPGIHFLEHPVKNPDDWDRYKERLDVDFGEQSRIHEVSYFAPFEPWPSWAEAAEVYSHKRSTGRYITMKVYGPWEIISRLRGYSRALMDLNENRRMVEEIIEHYTCFLMNIIKKGIDSGIKADALFLLDDICVDRGLLFSPTMIRELFLPAYKSIGKFLKDKKMDFFLHCCGDAKEIIPMYIEAGVDALNPLQATVIDIVEIKKKYGNDITLFGNINSRIMHDRSAIAEELNRKIPSAMKNGGFIFSCDHSIPSIVSLADYKLILEQAKNLCTYK